VADPFVAEVRIVTFNFAPVGWAFCNGQLMPISQNTALFSLVGTMYGGDGKSMFGLPDLRDRVVMGPGQGAGLTNRLLGESGGESAVTLHTAAMPAHSHGSVKAHDAAAASGSPGFGNLARANTSVYAPADNLVAMGDTAGGGLPHENRQPYLALNFIIALQGIFPARQ
jgi:microcystin-dependent protein